MAMYIHIQSRLSHLLPIANIPGGYVASSFFGQEINLSSCPGLTEIKE